MDKTRAKRMAVELQGRLVGGWEIGPYLGNGFSAVVMRKQRVEVEIYPLITTAIWGTASERGGTPEGPGRNFARSIDLIGGRLNEALAMLKLLRDGGGDREGGGSRRRRAPPR